MPPRSRSRNYSLATGWNRLIEVQGFGQRFIDADGVTVGAVGIKASAATRYITFTVPAAALGGTPGPGWTFAVVLTGQDGFSRRPGPRLPSRRRRASSSVSVPRQRWRPSDPICGVDPATVPKAIDILTPDGVTQAEELTPLPVGRQIVIQAVTIP